MVKVSKNPQLKLKVVIVSLFVTVGVIIYGLYFLQGLTVNIKASKVKVEEERRDLKLLDKIVKDKNQYDTEIKKAKNTIPSQYYEIAFFTEELNKLAGANGLTLQVNVDKKKKDEKLKYNSVVYSLETRGSYSSVSTFLSQMSKLPYHTTVDSLEMNAESGELISKIKFRLFVEK
jgi:Tfp pilus assembly protein PilO